MTIVTVRDIERSCRRRKYNLKGIMPPPPPESPLCQIMNHNTVQEIKEELAALSLETKGLKSDLAIRLVKAKTGLVTSKEIDSEFTKDDLRARLKHMKRSSSKLELCEEYLKTIE